MDKQTLSNYGWIVICILVLSVMIALATPFGSFIANGVKSTTQGLFDASQKAFNNVGFGQIADQEFDVPDMDYGGANTIVAYVYNGNILPDINQVWTDKATYPYGTIAHINDTLVFICSHTPYFVDENYASFYTPAPEYADSYRPAIDISWNEGDYDSKVYLLSNRTWVSSIDGVGEYFDKYDILWTNYDIFYTTGPTIFLEACNEPTPVYGEASELITFTFSGGPFNWATDGATLYAEKGMTWGEWVESQYNINGFSIYEAYNNHITHENHYGSEFVDFEGVYQCKDDVIIDGGAYTSHGP